MEGDPRPSSTTALCKKYSKFFLKYMNAIYGCMFIYIILAGPMLFLILIFAIVEGDICLQLVTNKTYAALSSKKKTYAAHGEIALASGKKIEFSWVQMTVRYS
ncbi:hypothetical protein SORBI_3007G189700 [Sorghum bicolor]|uniref:Uncharacterized protein n=1 Tax=Sorghum bicolor TaxID=4558 RepID=A0A1B6PIJ2_SORBI|nr:hypothetical protein SORBI_3007G189700 [Sorghum bicolor]